VRSLQAQLAEEGDVVPLSKLCRWLGVPRRTMYYESKARRSTVDEEQASQVKTVIERFPT